MDKRTFKTNIYDLLSQIGKTLGNGNRLEIIDLLANGPKSVEEIVRQTALSVANASQHLQVLRRARLVSVRREGTFIYYSLANAEVQALWRSLRNLGLRHSAEVQDTLRTFRQEADSSSIALEALPTGGRTILLDVRPAAEYQFRHLPGALHIPLDELPERLAEVPREQLIVAYCRGPFCTYADEAVRLLRREGYEAVRLEEGVADVQFVDEGASGPGSIKAKKW